MNWSVVLLLSWLSTVMALYSKKDAVIEISSANWDKEVTQSKHVVIVEFFAPWCGHCKAFAPEYKKAAESLKGLVKVAAVDCDDHRDLCGRYGIKGFPTVKVFGSDKSKPPVDYNGQRKAGDLVDFSVAMITDKFVTQIGTNPNRQDITAFLEKSSSPKVILFNKKYGIPPLFKALAVDFEGKINFGEIKSTEEALVKQFNVDTFPTVLVFKDAEPVKYDGQMKHMGLSDFFKGLVGESADEGADEEKVDLSVPQIQSQEFKKQCIDQTILCIVAFINLEPEFEESVKAQKEAVAMLEGARLKLRSRASSFKIVWVNAMEHGRQLMRDADVSDILPGLLGIHVKRGFYRNFRGAFEQNAIENFISDILLGQGSPNVRLQFDAQLDKPVKDEL